MICTVRVFRLQGRSAAQIVPLMSNHIYKKLELVGSSPQSIEAAVENALARARKTIRNMRWFELGETRGHIVDGKVDHWQVTVKVGFTLDE
jgi:dodecin